MKSIVYNLHNIRTPITGIGRYTIELLRGSLNSSINISLAYDGKLYNQDSIKHLLSLLETQTAQGKTDWRKIVGKMPFSRELYRQLDNVRFSNLVSQKLVDGAIYHDLNYSPCSKANSTISTIYDLSFSNTLKLTLAIELDFLISISTNLWRTNSLLSLLVTALNQN